MHRNREIALAGLLLVGWLTPECCAQGQSPGAMPVVPFAHPGTNDPCRLSEGEAGAAARTAILPPVLPWHGRSESLVVAKDDPWVSPAEVSDFQSTPRYRQTIEWLQRLTQASPSLELISLGRSPEGRDIFMVIASADKAFTPASLRATGKPTLLAQAGWMDTHLTPTLTRDLEAMGHVPGPLVFEVDDQDLSKGILRGTTGPRYSEGYGNVRHLPAVLVENHSLKSHAQRVLGTYVLMESVLTVLGRHGAGLCQAIEQDRQRQAETVPLTWKEAADSPPQISFLGISYEIRPSPITGTNQIVWTGRPATFEIPLHLYTKPDLVVRKPKAYWVPAAWTEVIERLSIHGLEMESLTAERTVEVEMYRLEQPRFSDQPLEGRVRVSARTRLEHRTQRFAPNSVRVPTAQPLGDLAVLLLEPDSPDFFSSGVSSTRSSKTPNTRTPMSWSPWPDRCSARTQSCAKPSRDGFGRTRTSPPIPAPGCSGSTRRHRSSTANGDCIPWPENVSQRI